MLDSLKTAMAAPVPPENKHVSRNNQFLQSETQQQEQVMRHAP